MIYIAHPNDQINQNGTQGGALDAYKGLVRRALEARRVPAYWPTLAYQGAYHDPHSTYDINEFALRRCSGMLAIMPRGFPSTGMPMEILTAHQLGKPVAVWTDVESMQLRAMGVPMFEMDEGPGLALSWLMQVTLQDPPRGPTFQWKGDPDCEPLPGYQGDAGFDLFVEKDTKIPVNGFVDVPHGICVELPPDTWALVTGRSSTIRRRGILVVNGIIDNGYRGPLFAAAQNLSDKPVIVKAGERIAQMIPFPLMSQRATFRRVAELSEAERGESAFGSSGA